MDPLKNWKRHTGQSTRIGFVGHSFGGGATPAVAAEYLVNRKWGETGAFCFIMAPWYAYDLSPELIGSFPARTKLIVQVYEDDVINDLRLAEDLYYSLPAAEKVFVIVHNDSCAAGELIADHGTPFSAEEETTDLLDFYGVFRLVHALSAYAFYGDSTARRIAVGGGTDEQVDMGRWPDGTPVTPLTVTDKPEAVYSEDRYYFRWSRDFNPRLPFYAPRRESAPAQAGGEP